MPGPAGRGASPEDGLKAELGSAEVLFEQLFEVDGGHRMAAAVTKAGERYGVLLLTDAPAPLLLHWGVARR